MTSVDDVDLPDLVREQQAELERLQKELVEWRARYAESEKRDIAFANSQGEVQPLYTLLDVADLDPAAIPAPGQYPFTRGIHATGYRGRLWTKRQFAGFGTAAETNKRFKFLLEHGQT
ncbi:MAG TPA: methylmalonyl-CoA mutase family protein, partial [Gemmatimonadaceae bacterium]